MGNIYYFFITQGIFSVLIQLFPGLMESKDNSYLQLPTVGSICSFLSPLLWEEVLSQDVCLCSLGHFRPVLIHYYAWYQKKASCYCSRRQQSQLDLPTVIVNIRKASALGSVGGGHKCCKFSFLCYICLYIYKYNVHAYIYKYKYIMCK